MKILKNKHSGNNSKKSVLTGVILAVLVLVQSVFTLVSVIKTEEKVREIKEIISKPFCEYEPIAKDIIDIPEDQIRYYKPDKAVDEDSLYYGKTYEDLYSDYTTDDEAVKLLNGLAVAEYGKAGYSLEQTEKAVDFITVSHMKEAQWSEIPAYLDSLTPLQLDYLSFCVIDFYGAAADIVNREASDELKSIGASYETFSNCTQVQLIRFLSYMFTLFEERGVNYEWEKYDILGCF